MGVTRLALYVGLSLTVLRSVWGDGDVSYKKGTAAYESAPMAAVGYFQQGAIEGHVGSMVGVATCFKKGHGAAVDYAKALEWFEKAARQNSLKGVEGLARIYASCPDPEFHDGPKAVKYASAVVRKKSMNPEALDLLAAAYLRNNQIEDAVKAGRKAVKYADSIDGARVLKARMVTYSEGQPIPAIATEEWIMRAAQQDVEWAVVKLIGMVGDPSVDMYNPQLAVLMCSKAAKMGRPEFYLDRGRIHFHEGRLEDAYASFCVAPRSSAAFRKGVPVELTYCRYLKQPKGRVFEMAEKLRAGYSMEESYMETVTKTGYDRNGRSYEYEEQELRTRKVLVPPKPAAARFLYEVAAKMGHPDAPATLVNLDKGPSEEDRVQAIALLDRMAKPTELVLETYFKSYCLDPNARNGEAAFQLMRLYQMGGRGVEKNSLLYWEWSQRAAEAGHPKEMRQWAGSYSLRDGPYTERALAYAKKLLPIAESGNDPDLWNIIAMAFARNNRFEDAIRYQSKAIEVASLDPNKKKKVPELKSRLTLYEQGIPYPPPNVE